MNTRIAEDRLRSPMLVLAILCVAIGTLTTGPATAYRTAAELEGIEGEAPRWAGGAFEYRLGSGLPPGASPQEFSAAVAEAFSVWERPKCSGFRPTRAGSTSHSPKFEDGVNSVAWVEHGWSDLGFEKGVPAHTVNDYLETEGGEWEIVESDIYLNAEAAEWVLSGPADEDQLSVVSVLIHEAGHAAGLLHPCEIEAEPGVAQCNDEFLGLAMHPIYDPSLTRLADDDREGICALYPKEGVASEATQQSPVPLVGGPCKKNRHCSPGLRCVDEICVGGDGQIGDPCDAHEECFSGACGDDGFCAHACLGDEDCPESGACLIEGRSWGTCASSARAFGLKCSDPTECIGGFCLDIAGKGPVCTRSCEDSCPGDWNCQEVDGEKVCAPTAIEPNGCTFSVQGEPCGDSSLGFLVVVALSFGLRLCRRWTSKGFSSAGAL